MSQVADQSPGSAPVSPNFAATLQRAYVYADEQAHRQVTAEHLLLALTEDPDCVAILRTKSVDLDHLRNEIAGLVSRNVDRFGQGEPGQPRHGTDIQRVLNMAGGAANARRPIDGALVLAALIADGRTPSAELIRLYGLTFEDAARGNRTKPDGTPASTHPPLATVRSAAREAALGLRKRASSPEQDQAATPARVPLSSREAASPPDYPPAARYAEQNPAPTIAHYSDRSETRAEPAASYNGQASASPGWDGRYNGHGPAQARYEADRPELDAAPANPEPDYAYPEFEPEPDPQWQTDAPIQTQTRARQPDPRQAPVDGTGATRRRKGAKGSRRKPDRGALVENIPRRMQVRASVLVEARIARHEIETALVDLANPGQPPGLVLPFAQTITVRLRDPSGAISIETGSPETQWIDGELGLIDDDYVSWRWTLTPNFAGPAKLQFVVSARSVDTDGASGEIALPEQTIDVRVSRDFGRAAGRIVAWIGVLAVTFGLGALGEHVLHLSARFLGH